MDFYTYTTRRIGKYVLALCLENGVTAQGITKEEALEKLNDALTSLKEAIADDPEIGTSPISIDELHEFITAGNESLTEVLELHAVHA
jgi:predicted RNase H-like HicB family nuclease